MIQPLTPIAGSLLGSFLLIGGETPTGVETPPENPVNSASGALHKSYLPTLNLVHLSLSIGSGNKRQ
jgi:hypothetical protein